ncbi:MAG TPA: FAD-dependent oxidoreductase, partial [Acidimicrobiales bacterium]|nr:FAD-dependent oxidoreductase [Acidimicrobiales bacterium]
MARIVVCGGGVVGLATAMMLARDGHEVTVLERDRDPVPAEPARAWDAWPRRGVAQFHQPHNLLPPVRLALEEELPGTVERLEAAGCTWMDFLDLMPPTIGDREPRPGDDRFRAITGRRPVVEAVLGRAAEEEPGVSVRRGVSVAGLAQGPRAVAGVPHVSGVRTTAGDELAADLVVDATGRRSPLRDWLAAIGGGPPHVETEEGRFVYHTRYFSGPRPPVYIGPPATDVGTFSVLTIPGDNSTWSVTLWASADDDALRAFRDPERFARVVRACPLQAHWLDGEPVTEVLTMAGIVDRYRRFVVDGRPVATGVVAVGDAWACTNPSAGRGIAVGLMHARRLRALVRSWPGDP